MLCFFHCCGQFSHLFCNIPYSYVSSLRTVLKDIDGFNNSYVCKLIKNEYQEVYDSSNNVLITPEEQEAFYRLRREQL